MNLHTNQRLDSCFSESPLGCYLHVPFCATTCDFCAFVQSKPNRELIENYLKCISKEWNSYKDGITKPISTIFWGGGTPGLLSANDLNRLGEIFINQPGFQNFSEWTIEMAPATVTPTKLKVLKELGVTRISMGIQTFNDETLKIMQRHHSTNQVMRAWNWIKEAEFQSTNIDMIIAFPGQSEEDLLNDLQQAINLRTDHLSTYCLTFEEDTPIYAKLMQGKYKIDLDKEADLYKSTWAFLESHDYHQYEISNFSKKGHQSLHNHNTWDMHEWIGLGPSASSQYSGYRYTNAYDMKDWLDGINKKAPQFEEKIQLTADTVIADIMIFGLRTNIGINLNSMQQRFPNHSLKPWEPLFEKLIKEELAIMEGSQFNLKLEGRLLADAIGAEILKHQP